MSTEEEPSSQPQPETPLGIDPVASRRIFLGMLGLLVGGVIAYNVFKTPPAPPPVDIAKDPLLVQGREIYQARCASCHGPEGKGDGAIAKNLPGPKVRNFAAEPWKYGEKPDDVIGVIAKGSKDTAMSAWGGVLDPPEIKAVAAYVYHLGGKPVPEDLRKP
ncbi:c-type cytochrome [Singulisphaera sp. PoT]|uniref:c-type cytochrome n=1 Tax=Singulisphaera sp. PoT TaxID=3411797 RepID=UPI003BF61996